MFHTERSKGGGWFEGGGSLFPNVPVCLSCPHLPHCQTARLPIHQPTSAHWAPAANMQCPSAAEKSRTENCNNLGNDVQPAPWNRLTFLPHVRDTQPGSSVTACPRPFHFFSLHTYIHLSPSSTPFSKIGCHLESVSLYTTRLL